MQAGSEAQAAKDYPSLASPKSQSNLDAGSIVKGATSDKETAQLADHTKALDALERDFREVRFNPSRCSLCMK